MDISTGAASQPTEIVNGVRGGREREAAFSHLFEESSGEFESSGRKAPLP